MKSDNTLTFFYQVWNFAWSQVFRRYQRRSYSAPSFIQTFVTT